MENIIQSFFSYSQNPDEACKTGSDHVCIIICTSGKAEIELETRTFYIYEKIFITIGPGKQYRIAGCSKDFRADIYSIRLDLLPIDELKHVYSLKTIYDEEPCRRIPEEKYIMCRFIGHYLKSFLNHLHNPKNVFSELLLLYFSQLYLWLYEVACLDCIKISVLLFHFSSIFSPIYLP